MQDQLFQNWGKSWLLDDSNPTEIKFQEDNKYMEVGDNLARAKQLIEVIKYFVLIND